MPLLAFTATINPLLNRWSENMKAPVETWMRAAPMCLLIAALSGCSARSAPEIKGHWKPINVFAENTEAIPLRDSYQFYPSPTDITLKTMLSRWAQDANMTLSYRHPYDFILHVPVAKIRTGDLQHAVAELTDIYALQGVSVTATQNEIVVAATESMADKNKSAESVTVKTE